jgi:hypothetical protein
MEDNLSASVCVRNKNNVWINDNMVTHCHDCRTEFGFFKRKHHCRYCGNIFCFTCTNQTIAIPQFITDRPDPADYWNISHYVTSFKANEEKVCKQCFGMIQENTKSYKKIVEIFNNPTTIDEIKKLSDSNMDIKNYYFDRLRNIQYYLPNHKYIDIDKKLLYVNAPYFCKHSKYLVHLIKSVEWSTPHRKSLEIINLGNNNNNIETEHNARNLDFIFGIINGDRNKKCSELYCTRTCQEELSCDDCINILFSNTDDLPNDLIKYLFAIISKTPEQVIQCQLSFFITMIRKNSSNKLLQSLIFNLLNQSSKLIYHTYWFLTNAKKESTLNELTNIDTFIKLFEPSLVKKMYQEYTFYAGLIDNLTDPERYLKNYFDQFKPITVPYDPTIELIGFDVLGITTKSSYTKPVVIPFETNKGKIKLLFKKECVMNDVSVLNLMTLSDIIIHESLSNPDDQFNVVVYPVMPLTANSGMIEIVDRAETIHTILRKKKTIYQYIFEQNEDKIIGDVMDRYMYSLVSYTLHSYFLGLGDRHLQNIMITDDGSIFHIDFGFILGTDAYPLTGSDIKLNSDMLEVTGGSGSSRYNKYLELCAKGVIILRKHFNMFFILLLQNTKFRENHVEKFIMTRFQPRQNDNNVVTELMSVIGQSNNTYSDLVRDFIHYHTQEKTVQNHFGRIFGAAYGAVKSLTGSNN